MKKSIYKVLNHIAIIFACLSAITPYILILLSSFSTSVNIKKGDIFSQIAVENALENFKVLISDSHFIEALCNSIIVAVATTFLGILLASLSGYAFVIYKNKHTDKLFQVIFFLIMIPSSALVIPVFMILRILNMLDSLYTVVIVSLSLPFFIYLFRQNTKLFPKELIRLARIDGLSEISIFFKVYVPNMKAVFVTAALILFIDSWNSLLYPLVIIQSQNHVTLPIYINSIGSSPTSNYGAFMIALIISTMPILVIFVLSQKHFRAGMRTM